MSRPADLAVTLIDSWRTNSRVTAYLVENIPAALWDATVPGAPRRTVRMIAGHLHNARCMWIKTLGQEHGLAVPASVDRRNVTRRQLLAALKRSLLLRAQFGPGGLRLGAGGRSRAHLGGPDRFLGRHGGLAGLDGDFGVRQGRGGLSAPAAEQFG